MLNFRKPVTSHNSNKGENAYSAYKKAVQFTPKKKKKRTVDYTDRAPKQFKNTTVRNNQTHKQGASVTKSVRKEQKKAYNETASGRFTQGFIRNGMMAGFPEETKATYRDSNNKKRKVSESKSYKAGKIVGDFLSYGTGYAAAGKAIAKATGKVVTKKIGQEIAEKAGEKVAKEVVKEGAEKATKAGAKKATEKVAEKTAEKAVKETAEGLSKEGAKNISTVGKAINKVDAKLGKKIANSKPVQKYAKKQSMKAGNLVKGKTKEQIAEDIGAKASQKITQNLIADATVGTALDTSHARGEGIEIGANKEYAKYMGTAALMNIGFGAGFEGLSAGAKKILQKQAAKKGSEKVLMLVNGKQKYVNVKNETKAPSTLKGKQNASRVRKLQKDVEDLPNIPTGKKQKDVMSPEQIRERKNVLTRVSNETKVSKKLKEQGIEPELDTSRSLRKKNNWKDVSNAKNVKDLKLDAPTSETALAKIQRAKKYTEENDINFSDVVKEHNGNRAEAIEDLNLRAKEAEKPPVEKKTTNKASEESNLDIDEIKRGAEDESKSAYNDIKDMNEYTAWRDYGTEKGAKNVDDAMAWMEEHGLDPNDDDLLEEVLSRRYLNEKEVKEQARKLADDYENDMASRGMDLTPAEKQAHQTEIENTLRKDLDPEEIPEGFKGEEAPATKEVPEKPVDAEGKVLVERPERPTGDSGKVSQHAYTIKNSPIMDEEGQAVMKDLISDGTANKRYKGNKQAVAEAEKRVSEQGLDEVSKGFVRDVKNGFEMQSERVAEAYVCLRDFVKDGAYDKIDDLAEALIHVESEAGRTLQSARLFRSLTPEGKVMSVDAVVKKLNQAHGTDIKIPDELKDALRDAKTQKEINDANKAISMYVWSRIPANWVERANAWRYLAMLGNPKTHMRNIVGNIVFMPVRTMRDVLATGVERVALSQADRTKAILNKASSKDRALLKLADDSWEDGIGDILKQNSKYIEGGGANNLGVRDMDAPIFRTKGVGTFLNQLYHLNGKALNAEDGWFMKPAYKRYYAQFLKAKGLTAETASKEMLKRAERYASDQALNSTYRDFNVIADKLNKVKQYANMKTKDIPSKYDNANDVTFDKRAKKLAGIATEALVPFAKTPINILERGLEYSPAGFAHGLIKFAKAKGDSDLLVDAISEMCAGVSGSTIVGLGFYFGKQGLATGSLDFTSKEDNYDKMLGKQAYSINIEDYTFTVDSVAPISLPFFMGVELGTSLRDNGEIDALSLISNADKLIDPIMNLSMLSSLNTALDNGFASGNSITSAARKTGESYLGQYLPTLGGQVTRWTQSEMTGTTATDEDPNIREYHRFLNQMKNKAGPLAKSNAPKVDNWGEKETNDAWSVTSFFQNTTNPFNVKKIKGDMNTIDMPFNGGKFGTRQTKADDVDAELHSLMEQGADNSVLPSSRPSKYTIKFNDNELRMSPKEFSKMQEVTGKESKSALRKLFSTEEYKNGSLEDKQKLISEVYSNAKTEAKRQLLYDKGYTKEDVAWNIDLSKGDREKVGSKSEFLKMLRKTDTTAEEFGKFHEEGLSVSDLMGAAETEISLKNYHVCKEAKSKYHNGYASVLGELYSKGIIKDLDEAKVYDSDAKINTFKYAKAMIDAGYTPDEIYEKTGDVEAVKQDIKDNYGKVVWRNGAVHMSYDGLQKYLDSREDLTNQDRHNLWLVYGGAQSAWMNRNPY